MLKISLTDAIAVLAENTIKKSPKEFIHHKNGELTKPGVLIKVCCNLAHFNNDDIM